MFKKENIKLIQENLKKDNIDGYLVLTTDPHFMEYIASYYKDERLFLAPFTGSAGEVLVTKNKSYLFTDGRYWVQAEKELKDSGVTLVKSGEEGVLPLNKFIKSIGVNKLGIDFSVLSLGTYKSLKEEGIEPIDISYRKLVKDITPLPLDPIFKLDDSLNTLTSKEKIELIKSKLVEENVDGNLISSLDDIAWILNYRGKDISCNPVFYSYLYISIKNGCHLFINPLKVKENILNITIHPYDELSDFINSHSEEKFLIDPSRTSMKIISNLKNIKYGYNPSYLLKAIKGDVEIKNIKHIQALDGLALVKFSKYLYDNLDKNLTEYEYSEKLKEFRLSNPKCFDLSFETIAAVGKNASEMHYAPTINKSSAVSSNDIELLVDSGGQYFGGTTDTTRTFLIGKPTKEYIHDYTLTLKSLINLSRTIFIKGCSGQAIDIKARQFMWDEGLDYKCGTGHGVGYILNVHEGPNGFRYKKVPERDDQHEIVPGMVTTIEPGVYKEGKYGIRIENNLLCINAFKTEMGEFYKFETITYVPILVDAVDFSMINDDELNWLNSYHQKVYEELSKLTKDKELLDYLKKVCRPISKF